MAKKGAMSSEFYRPIVSLIVGLLILVIINAILKNLPMIRSLYIPGTSIWAGSIVSAVIGLIMISLFLNFRRDFAPRVRDAFPNEPDAVVLLTASINLGLVIIIYTMFDGLAMPFMGSFAWVYQLVFLALAIPFVYIIAMTLYRWGSKVTVTVTSKMAEATGEMVKCGNCGAMIDSDTKYCPKCGANKATITLKPTATICAKCGTENKPGNVFCGNCGYDLSKNTATI